MNYVHYIQQHVILFYSILWLISCIILISINYFYYKKQKSKINTNDLIKSILASVEKKISDIQIEHKKPEVHDSRHSFAQHLLESGEELEQVAIKCQISHDEAALIRRLNNRSSK